MTLNLQERNYFQLGGLNLYQPDDVMKDNETPYARNFRIYQSDDLEARTNISKRPGHTKYSVPVGETDRGNQTSTTGAADQSVYSIYWLAQKFTVSAGGRLSKISLNVKNDSLGTGPLLVDIYSEVSSAPGVKLASSSISQADIAGTYGYVDVKFIEAPVVATSTNYYIVIHQQSEGTYHYSVSSTTSATTALTSSSAGNSWSAANFALNYHVYVSTDAPIKAVYRYYRSTTSPITLVVAGTTIYSVNDATGALTSINSSLDASAVNYRFVTVNDVIYMVNGVDTPKTYDGSTFGDMGGSPGVSIDICLHKDRVWLLHSDNKIIFSDPAAYTTFGATSFLYAPAPKSADPAVALIPFQDNIIVFSKNCKFVISGSDISTIVLRESTATKGATNMKAICKDSNYIYFLSHDGAFIFNGGSDIDFGIKIARTLDNIGVVNNSSLVVHNQRVRIYYTPSGQSKNTDCLIYDLNYKQWMHDDEVYIGGAAVFNSQTDDNVLVEYSSVVGAIYYGETGTSDLGKPILFDYWTKYFSFGNHPSRKQRLKRLYAFFNSAETFYNIDVQVDADKNNNPSSNFVNLGVDGSLWGDGVATWGDGVTTWGGGQLKPTRISVPGRAREHQIRFVQHGVDNPVELIGFSTYTQIGKPI